VTIWLLYNAIMTVADLGAMDVVRRNRKFAHVFLATGGVGMLALVVGLLLGEHMFHTLALFAQGVFIHLPLVLGGSSVLCWRVARRSALAGIVATTCLVAVGVDAFFIEPTWLEVTHVQLTSTKLRAPLRIVVIADLQTDQVGAYERRVLERALAERPDMILLAGDYLQSYDMDQANRLRGELAELLYEVRLSAPLGVYAVSGNVEIPRWQQIFSRVPVTALDQTTSIDLERDDLRITALSLSDSLDTTFTTTPSERFHICVGHSPNYALGNPPADLIIAGHTHGGQVRLPGIGPLITLSRVPRDWAAGLTQMTDGRCLLVSRGIGMERGLAPRLRFMCRPELVVVDVRPAAETK